MRSPFRRPWGRALCAGALVCAAAHADDFVQRPPHVHGHVTVNVAVEDQQLQVELVGPAINVVGFEHAPHTAAERAAVQQAAQLFNAGKGLVGTPPEAGCTFQKAKITEPHWEADNADESQERHEDEHGEHADYLAQLTYRCAAPAQLTWIEPQLVGKLLHVVEARVNVVTAAGQRSQSAAAGDVRVALP